MTKIKISGWGRNKFILSELFLLNDNNFSKNVGFIARGSGKSYGDNALSKIVISTSNKTKILAFNKIKGIITVESGISIDKLIEETIKEGWILNVIPGAKNVTIGGAIANDIHGKNHYKQGSFSKYIQELTVLTENFGLLKCSKKKKLDLFRTTCGGLGLTGIVTSATIRLRKINSEFLRNDTFKCNSINKMIHIFEKYKKSDYMVGWYDFFSKQDKFIISVGNHTDRFIKNHKEQKPVKKLLPSFFLNNLTIKIFNFFYYFLKNEGCKLIHYKKFFFPLDNIENWNKLYGNKGFYQYQFVIPEKNSEINLRKIINKIKKSNYKPYLAVIKKMGLNNSNYLSFPLKGYSFALDFKNKKNITKFFDELDRNIIQMEGRVYLAKDSSLKKEKFFKMYRKVNLFKKVILKYNPKGKIASLQSSRLHISNN